jgi:hypothetical protein
MLGMFLVALDNVQSHVQKQIIELTRGLGGLFLEPPFPGITDKFYPE